MPTERTGEDGVHRLVDMVVEEVSLVDRAANLHRFLVVKRDPTMAKAAPKKTPKKTPAAPPGKEAPAKSTPPRPTKKASSELLTVATDALESLTAAVEQMGEASDEDAASIVEGLIEDLTELAARLAETAGLASDEEETAKRDATSVEGVRDLLGKVRALLDEVSKDQSEPAEQQEQTPTPSEEVAERVSSQLTQLSEDLATLTTTLREQGQRLGRLEKGVGLPNSRSAPERPASRADEDEESWPLDMNRPHDRGSEQRSPGR